MAIPSKFKQLSTVVERQPLVTLLGLIRPTPTDALVYMRVVKQRTDVKPLQYKLNAEWLVDTEMSMSKEKRQELINALTGDNEYVNERICSEIPESDTGSVDR